MEPSVQSLGYLDMQTTQLDNKIVGEMPKKPSYLIKTVCQLQLTRSRVCVRTKQVPRLRVKYCWRDAHFGGKVSDAGCSVMLDRGLMAGWDAHLGGKVLDAG